MEIRYQEAASCSPALGMEKLSFGADKVAYIPQGCEHDDEGMGLVYDTIAFYPTLA
jgi:hypothetical protein